jgi:hypothetical protein
LRSFIRLIKKYQFLVAAISSSTPLTIRLKNFLRIQSSALAISITLLNYAYSLLNPLFGAQLHLIFLSSFLIQSKVNLFALLKRQVSGVSQILWPNLPQFSHPSLGFRIQDV